MPNVLMVFVGGVCKKATKIIIIISIAEIRTNLIKLRCERAYFIYTLLFAFSLIRKIAAATTTSKLISTTHTYRMPCYFTRFPFSSLLNHNII